MESIANLIPAMTKVGEAAEEASEQMEGFNRYVHGKPQWYALSGSDRRRQRRAAVRSEAAIQRKGQRAYNRQQRQAQFDAGTVRQQLRILKGEVEVTPAMMTNLQSSIERAHDLAAKADRGNGLKLLRRVNAEVERRQARFSAGKPRGKDLRDGVFELYSHLLPADYAGKRAA